MKNKLLIFTTLYIVMAYLVIKSTPLSESLIFDAQSYYNRADSYLQQGISSAIFSNNGSFIDNGYPLALSFFMKLVGDNSVVLLQVLNYVFWVTSSWFIYRSLINLSCKYASRVGLLTLFSPVFLTFSSKIYSEPYAALGVSLLTFAITMLINKEKFTAQLALVAGSFILFSTKSVFILFVPILLIILLMKKRWISLLYLLISLILLAPLLISSSNGGRSLYNLAIQSSKLDQSYDQIFSCAPYYLSYPLGKALLPKYEAICHQNDPDPKMEGYYANPYVLASAKREAGYNYLEWFNSVINQPIKYLIIILVSLTNILLVEGIYPTILLKLPVILMFPLFFICKILLSLYLWSRVVRLFYGGSYWWLLPIMYFAVVVTNFPIESRYFYPLIPYLYFLTGLSYKKV